MLTCLVDAVLQVSGYSLSFALPAADRRMNNWTNVIALESTHPQQMRGISE